MQQNYLLEIDGKPAGRFFAFTGGTIQADVILESAGADNIRHKHISSVKYQDMVLSCGTGMSRGFYEWLGATFGGSASRKNGAVVALDQRQAPTARLEFMHALVSSLILPKLDKSANEAAFMTVKISPEVTRSTGAEASAKPGVYISSLPKAWNISDFRLRIDGLETDCAHVTKIDSLSLGQKVAEDYIGASRDAQKEAGSLEYSDLVIRLPEMYASGFFKWLDDFVAKGNNSPQFEKKGTLEFFAPHSSKAYFGIQFGGLGIREIAGSSALRTKTSLPVAVGMYCESMNFYAGPSAII